MSARKERIVGDDGDRWGTSWALWGNKQYCVVMAAQTEAASTSFPFRASAENPISIEPHLDMRLDIPLVVC